MWSVMGHLLEPWSKGWKHTEGLNVLSSAKEVCFKKQQFYFPYGIFLPYTLS